jgi:plastocyanin
MARIDIIRTDSGAIAFDPNPVQVLSGDTVFWANLDPQEEHKISLQRPDSPKIARKAEGTPADTSEDVIVRAATDYSCTLHPEEKGKITI